MRARSPSKSWSLAAVVSALASACSPNDEPLVSVPEPATTVPETEPGTASQDDDIGDVTTPLEVDAERYVDCVANPAAAAWGTAGPGAAR